MLIRSSLAVLLGLMVCGSPVISVHAQQNDERDVVYEAGRNKIGLLRYCRDNTLLDRGRADSAASAVEAGIAGFAPGDPIAMERGERAEKAGEAGFWEANGKRDLASLATLFGTTPAGLCQEWAEETLRNQQAGITRHEDLPAPPPQATPARDWPAAKAESRARPPLPAKEPLSFKPASRTRDAARKGPVIQTVARPVMPERGPRAEAAARRATEPPPEQNRWDSAKVAIRVPFIRFIRTRPATPANPATKALAPRAAVGATEERAYQRPRPWQVPSRCTIESGPPQLSTRCNRIGWSQ